nr:hypothetical protein [uncultured Actinoplanes sp.]
MRQRTLHLVLGTVAATVGITGTMTALAGGGATQAVTFAPGEVAGGDWYWTVIPRFRQRTGPESPRSRHRHVPGPPAPLDEGRATPGAPGASGNTDLTNR